MLAVSKAIPKEMLPLVYKPLIQYLVSEYIKAGFTEIVLVTPESKAAIEKHVDTSFELEFTLEKRVKPQFLEGFSVFVPQDMTVLFCVKREKNIWAVRFYAYVQ